MRYISTVVAACGLLAAAQDIDFDLIKAQPNPTYTTTLSSVAYNPTAVLKAALSQITPNAEPNLNLLHNAVPFATVVRRDTACERQPAGATGAPAVVDNPDAFVNNAEMQRRSQQAPMPVGYTRTFVNLKASNNAYGYMGFTRLNSYDTQECANRCNKVKGCSSFNIYWERSYSLLPAPACPNPKSVTLVKCVYWGGPVNQENAVNTGETVQQFKVVKTGSNGYQKINFNTPKGYTKLVNLDNAAIKIPDDNPGISSYLGSVLFTSGPYDPQLCADACTAKSKMNLDNAPEDGSPAQTCQFFNTYIVYINTSANYQGQYCAMYSQTWGKEFATNRGQTSGNDRFLISYSYSSSNATDPGTPNNPPLPIPDNIPCGTREIYNGRDIGYRCNLKRDGSSLGEVLERFRDKSFDDCRNDLTTSGNGYNAFDYDFTNTICQFYGTSGGPSTRYTITNGPGVVFVWRANGLDPNIV